MKPTSAPVDIHSEEFLASLMRRQLWLSISCTAAFLIALLGLPLLNFLFPDLMAKEILGFTLTWFILGILFFPFVWVIAWVFIRRSIALETSEANEVLGDANRPGTQQGAPLGSTSPSSSSSTPASSKSAKSGPRA